MRDRDGNDYNQNQDEEYLLLVLGAGMHITTIIVKWQWATCIGFALMRLLRSAGLALSKLEMKL